MEILIPLLSLLVCFNFILKQTGHGRIPVLLAGVVCCLFVGLSWPWAIEQSRTEIQEWMADRSLVADLTVLLTLDVFFQMRYCWKPSRFLHWFPGLLLFPVLFALLVSVIFSFPGYSFSLLAWSLGVLTAVVLWSGVWLMKYLLPARELRLELLYQTSWLTAVLGFTATLNGQTTVTGAGEVDWLALAGVLLLLLCLALVGWMIYRRRQLCFRKTKNEK